MTTMMNNSSGETPLIAACRNCQLNQVRYLIKKAKVNPNENGNLLMNKEIYQKKRNNHACGRHLR